MNINLKIILLQLLLGVSSATYTQTYEWAKSIGGTINDYGNSIAVDVSGNVYTTGVFKGTVDFDPGTSIQNLTSNGNNDIFISKLDPNSNYIWAKNIGGTNHDHGYSITVDAAGNVYTTGSFEDTVNFDPGTATQNLTSNGIRDIFISKLDINGNYLWAKNIGGTGIDISNSIAVDAAGNIYTTGIFQGTVDFDPGASTQNLTSSGGFDIFISKLDANGNYLWTKSIGGTSADAGYSIAVDVAGNVYTTGVFKGTVDFDPGTSTQNLTSHGDNDIFISKLDANGNYLWTKSIGGISADHGYSIAVDATGNVYTTGGFGTTVDFDPGPGIQNLISNGNSDLFVSKLSTNGNYLWAKSIGGTSTDYSTSIAIDITGNVYTTGQFGATVDFDPGATTQNLTSIGSSDIFVSKLSTNGNYLWAKSINGTNTSYSNSIAVDPAENVYTTGGIRGTVDFDPGTATQNLTSNGDQDIFISKLSPCTPTTSIDLVSACNSYTWINGITYTASNSTAKDTLTNLLGCDSVITLNLTINTLPTVTIPAFNPDTVCVTSPVINLPIGTPATGTYSGNGVSGLTFNPSIAGIGVHYVVYTFTDANSCSNSDSSMIVVNSCVGINEKGILVGVTIYPNPTHDIITISLSDLSTIATITLTTVKGRVLQQLERVTNKNATIDMSNLSKGIYFLRVTVNDNYAIYKVIKE